MAMASIRKRNNRWEVRVRRTGQPTQAKTFTLKSDAIQWAREAELALERGHLNPVYWYSQWSLITSSPNQHKQH